MSKLNLATDPEMFIKTSNGVVTSVAGLLGCSKSQKLHFDGVRLQEDNVLAEFDIDPASTFEEFDKMIQEGFNVVNNIVNPMGLVIAEGVSSHIYTPEEMSTFAESAFEFGCEPDFNGLTGMKNPKPQAADEGLRSAGGHIHFGFDDRLPVTEANQKLVTVLCDYYLGLASVLMDNDTRRRELYGKAGALRFKPYGIEYRTLSNFWIFTTETRLWAWETAHKVYEKAVEISNSMDARREFFTKIAPMDVQKAINSGDKQAAKAFLEILN